MAQPFRPQSTTPRTLFQYDVTQQTTLSQPLVADRFIQNTAPDATDILSSSFSEAAKSEFQPQIMTLFKRAYVSRVIAVSLVIGLIIGLYLLWRPVPPVSTTTDTASVSSTLSATTTVNTADTSAIATSTVSTTIQVYIVGAVQHPGVYTIDSQARVYQLLQKAGGPLATADMTALNLAARLSDGQEVDVLRVGETPTASTSTSSSTANATSTANIATTPNAEAQVNINTASADELKQQLSVSSKTAQTIIDYRLQHGPFTSVDTLAQVVSQSIYKKIKDKVIVQ